MTWLVGYCLFAYGFVGLVTVQHFRTLARRGWHARLRAKLHWAAFVVLAPLVLPAAVVGIAWNW